VTDRRALVVTHAFFGLAAQSAQWFEVRGDRVDAEHVREVRVGRSRLCGPFLDIVSEDPVRRWWRRPLLRVRLYMRDPERVRRAIADAMAALGHGEQAPERPGTDPAVTS
jgi:hypothetical protein